MPEYVDKKELCRNTILCEINGKLARAVPVATIQTTKAADVTPIIHGAWEWREEDIWGYCCSICGSTAPWGGRYDKKRPNFCPECGAKMDGGEHHD